MRGYSRKGIENRRKLREGFSDFFMKHVETIKKEKLRCEECGCKLIGDVSEVAHILPKQRFKSIATNDLNVVYLCCRNSIKNCHAIFDDSALDVVKDMEIYPKIRDRFKLMKKEITEKLNWKDLEKYE